ncbi:hypothetical protein JMM81_07415 [Bacillus sp. V3B]|uniref:hypothetical protein n=1 Tax=Bacillus sp. V3B TaxID=2804915 RepID=UPI0021088E5E|nr:hypothetical protein [Bacillus sp. V3B]MCQ6274797.1 hypothetical protein [Bacillus sp. V3B]
MTDFVTDNSVTASPKVEPQVVMNSESTVTASSKVKPQVVINPEFQVQTEQHNTNVNDLNHVAKAQKQISSQETVGVLPQE